MINLIFFIYFLIFSTNIYSEIVGAQFLKIGIGSRPIGMGNAFTAISNDVSGIYYNPAGLVQLNKREISAMHNSWIIDTSLDFVGLAYPLNSKIDKGVLGFGIINLSYGDIEARDENRQIAGTYGASDTSLTVAYSRNIKNLVSYGLNLKLIQQRIEKETATGIGFDIGILYKTSIKNLQTGLSIQNIGPQMKFITERYNLPLTITAGVGYNMASITIGFDIKNYIYEGKTTISIGTEYIPVGSLSLRAGYLLSLLNRSIQTSDRTDQLNDTGGLGAGIGIKIYAYALDWRNLII